MRLLVQLFTNGGGGGDYRATAFVKNPMIRVYRKPKIRRFTRYCSGCGGGGGRRGAISDVSNMSTMRGRTINMPISTRFSHAHNRPRAGRYYVRISVPAPTQSGFLKTQWVGVRPLHPLLSLTNL